MAARTVPLQSGPALGAAPVFAGGETWHWEVQLADLYDQTIPDVVLTRADGTSLA